MAYQILVVEDEPDTRELPEYSLRWTGHHVHVTASGGEALERLAIRSYDVTKPYARERLLQVIEEVVARDV